MPLTTLLLFAASSIALAVTPGPTMLLALANGAAGGRRAAAAGILGASLAAALLIAGVAVGLGALLKASGALFESLRAAGVLYLCWIAFRLWRAPVAAGGVPVPGVEPSLRPRRAFVRSATVALSNPKTILFFTAFLPQFVDPAQPQAAQYAVLGAMFLVIDALVMACYAGAGTSALRLMSARALRRLNRGVAAVLVALASTLALYRRSAA